MTTIKEIIHHARHGNTQKLTEMGFWNYSMDLGEKYRSEWNAHYITVTGDKDTVKIDLSGFDYDAENGWNTLIKDKVKVLIHD